MTNTSSTATHIPTIGDLRSEMASVLVRTADVLTHVEPNELPTSQTPALLDQFVALERLAASGRVLLAAKAVESERWKRDGFANPADWLADKSGCGAGTARQDLETSSRLGKLRDTADAMRDGQLSPDQASAITDACTINPDAEADLIDKAANDSLKQLKDEAARRKAERDDMEAKAKRVHRQRSNRSWVDRDGVWNRLLRGPIEAGADFDACLEPWIRTQYELARSEGRHEGREQYAFDAAMALARFADQHTHVTPDQRADAEPSADSESGAGDAASSRDPDVPTRPQREHLRHLALLRVDLAALVRGHVDDGDLCEIDGLGPISMTAARELLGESILKLVITKGEDVVNVTHLGRGPNVAQDVALLWSDPVCTVLGCNHTIRLEADHHTTWVTEKVTRLRNLGKPCKFHHDQKTLHGWDLVAGTGRRRMVPPEHPDHPRNRAGP